MSETPSPSVESDRTSATPATSANAHPQGGLWSVSFVALVVTQFLVAMNDNVFRWLLIPIGKSWRPGPPASCSPLCCWPPRPDT